MVPVKNYGNVFVVLQKHPFTHSLDTVERCSISVKCSARSFADTFLVDMCAMVLILSLAFAPSRAKTGTVFLRGINCASGVVYTANPTLNSITTTAATQTVVTINSH